MINQIYFSFWCKFKNKGVCLLIEEKIYIAIKTLGSKINYNREPIIKYYSTYSNK
jgi:hypothetical protein